MTRSPSWRAPGLLAAALVTLAMGAAALSGVAHASQSCKPPAFPGSGYFTSLKVTNTSCTTGRKVAVAYDHCRVKSGLAGHCHQSVAGGFTCHEGKRVTIPTEFDAKVSCYRGRATVVFYYQQNT